MYDLTTLKLWPADAILLESGVVRWKYVDGFAQYRIKQPKTKWWYKTKRVLVWNWFKLKMYIQPPLDKVPVWLDEDNILIASVFDAYAKPILRTDSMVMQRWNKVRTTFRNELLSSEGIECDNKLFE